MIFFCISRGHENAAGLVRKYLEGLGFRLPPLDKQREAAFAISTTDQSLVRVALGDTGIAGGTVKDEPGRAEPPRPRHIARISCLRESAPVKVIKDEIDNSSIGIKEEASSDHGDVVGVRDAIIRKPRGHMPRDCSRSRSGGRRRHNGESIFKSPYKVKRQLLLSFARDL